MADDELIEEWKEVQREVASRVVERISYYGAEGDATAPGEGHRFECLPLKVDDGDEGNSNDEDGENDDGDGDSSSDGPLYGGVDVSFAPSGRNDDGSGRTQQSRDVEATLAQTPTAVAVYVVLRRRRRKRCLNSSGNSSRRRKQLHSDIVSANFELVYFDSTRYTPNAPYISGYLAFREIEPLQTLVQRQIEQQPNCTPRVIMVDGNGILHPRRAGIACFLGVRTGIPTIGIGKKLCCVEDCWTIDRAESAIASSLGAAVVVMSESQKISTNSLIVDTRDVSFDDKTDDSGSDIIIHKDIPPSITMKDSVVKLPLTCRGYVVNLRASDGKVLGAALVGHGGRLCWAHHGKPTSNPIYVSVGHEISLKKAIVLCAELSNVRIPEPVRVADLLGRKIMREIVAGRFLDSS